MNWTYFYDLTEGAEKEPESDRDLVHELWIPFFHNDKHKTIRGNFDEIVDGCSCGCKIIRVSSSLETEHVRMQWFIG